MSYCLSQFIQFQDGFNVSLDISVVQLATDLHGVQRIFAEKSAFFVGIRSVYMCDSQFTVCGGCFGGWQKTWKRVWEIPSRCVRLQTNWTSVCYMRVDSYSQSFKDRWVLKVIFITWFVHPIRWGLPPSPPLAHIMKGCCSCRSLKWHCQ